MELFVPGYRRHGCPRMSGRFSKNKEQAEAISILIHFDVERHRRLRFEKGKMFGNLYLTFKKIRQPDLRDCTQNFSDFAMCKL